MAHTALTIGGGPYPAYRERLTAIVVSRFLAVLDSARHLMQASAEINVTRLHAALAALCATPLDCVSVYAAYGFFDPCPVSSGLMAAAGNVAICPQEHFAVARAVLDVATAVGDQAPTDPPHLAFILGACLVLCNNHGYPAWAVLHAGLGVRSELATAYINYRRTRDPGILTSACSVLMKAILGLLLYANNQFSPSRAKENIRAIILRHEYLRKYAQELVPPLHYIYLAGRVARGELKSMMGVPARTADRILAVLLSDGLLMTSSQKGPVWLGAPDTVITQFLPWV